jgi:hypothetical protein
MTKVVKILPLAPRGLPAVEKQIVMELPMAEKQMVVGQPIKRMILLKSKGLTILQLRS